MRSESAKGLWRKDLREKRRASLTSPEAREQQKKGRAERGRERKRVHRLQCRGLRKERRLKVRGRERNGAGIEIGEGGAAESYNNDSADSTFLQYRNRVVTSLAPLKTASVNGADTLKEYGHPQDADDRNY